MAAFEIVPAIGEYQSFGAFAEAAGLTDRDLIFTGEHVYKTDLARLGLPCRFLLRNRYPGGEPTDKTVDAILSDLQETDYDRLIAVGGGTIIDIAKLLAVAEGKDRTDDLYDRAATLTQIHPLYIVPTTCGTGSEVTGISIIGRTRLGTKQGIVSSALFPREAVLIPAILEGLPYQVFATSSMDAMIHAVESFLSPRATAWSELFSEKALELILNAWKRTVERQGNWEPDARDFLIASNYAGIAFGNAGCGAVHALSYPLGGEYHVPHREANQVMFAPVMKAYAEAAPGGKLARLEALLGVCLNCAPEEGLEVLYALLEKILPRKSIREYGVAREELAAFAATVEKTQQRLLGSAYIPLNRDEILKIYERAYERRKAWTRNKCMN